MLILQLGKHGREPGTWGANVSSEESNPLAQHLLSHQSERRKEASRNVLKRMKTAINQLIAAILDEEL